jgi:hypothetical protein
MNLKVEMHFNFYLRKRQKDFFQSISVIEELK